MERSQNINRHRSKIEDKNILNKIKDFLFKSEYSKSAYNKTLFSLVVLMGILGLLILLSASSYLTIKYGISRYYYFIRQGVYLIVGIVAMIIVSKINYRLYQKYAFYIYLLSIFLLILVYVPGISVLTNGARRSIKIGFTFMPSDFAKLAAIFALSKLLIVNRENNDNFLRSVLPTGALIAIPFFLILFQTDLSTSLVLILTLISIYIVGGLKIKFFIPVAIIGSGVAFVLFKNLRPYQVNRITAFLNPEAHYEDFSWQVLNGLFAVSRGGLSGVGYGKSIYKHGYLATEVINDMIFAVVGEEFGFIGSLVILLIIFAITLLVIREGIKSKNKFAKLTAFGIGILYFLQSMINIGVSLSIIPNTGITLPLISNGGTSLIVFYIMFGVVLNISRENNYYEKIKKKKISKVL